MSSISTDLSLSSDQVEQYQQQGYLILRELFTPDEMAALAAEADTLLARQELIHSDNIRCRWSSDSCEECLFDCFDPVIDIAPVCRYFANDQRILAALGTLFGDTAHLFKDKLIFKRPGARGYGLHQDYIGWDGFPESFVTVIAAIDPADGENGATEVFPQAHHQGYLSPRDGEYHELPLDAVDESTGVLLDLSPGDIGIFSGFTPHRSAANQSDRFRRQLYLSYNAGCDGGDRRAAHYEEFHTWLRQKYAEYGKTEVYFR